MIDRNRARATPHIVPEDADPVLAAVREAAAKRRHLGRRSDRWRWRGRMARWANRAFVIDAGGKVAARYDKIHMFDVDLATRRELA